MSILLRNLFWVCFFLFVPLSLFPFPESELVEYRSGIIKDEDVVVLPQFPGGEEAMKKYLVIDVLLPEGYSPEWLVDRILYSIVVTASGEISDVKLKTPISKLKGHISKEILDKAYWLVKNMPKWTPGTRNGLPEDMDFELVEPVRILFKDVVRVVGDELGLPHDMVYRQPFPGPGLGVRCPGAISRDRLEAVRESDAILREEFDKNGLAGKIWQYFTVVPEFRSTGIKNGKRAFEWCCIVRAVCTTDVMTATAAEIPHEVMVHITDRITHEVAGINRVLYDFTPKPTGTVEFE